MRKQSILQFIEQTQYTDSNQVYCPMCETLHNNDTLCQAPGWGN